MSNSDRDSGAWVIIVAMFAILLVGGGWFVFQKMRVSQLAALEAQRRAEAAQQLAKMQQALNESTPALQAHVREQQRQVDNAAIVDTIQSKLANQQADWNKGDIDGFMKVYWKSDELTFASGGKVTRGWQATLENYKSKYSTTELMGTLTFSDLEFQRLDNLAMLVLGNWHLERGENSVGGNFTLIWKNVDNDWVIIHDHTSSSK